MNDHWGEPFYLVLALLACGHLLSDFLFQTTEMVRAKKNSKGALAKHAGIVACVQGATILPVSWSLSNLGLIALVAASHFFIDALKVWLDRAWKSHRLWWFLLDQTLHAVALFGVATLWSQEQGNEALARLAIAVGIVVFSAHGAAALVRHTLAPLGPKDTGEEESKGAGKTIGILERWMILGLTSMGEWGAVGLVLTAKSIARFRRMDEQKFAEIYLVGTMTSVLVAMVCGVLLRLLVLG